MSGAVYYSKSGSTLASRAENMTRNVGAAGAVLREFASAMTDLQGAMLREVVAGLRDAGLPKISLHHARSCSFPEPECCDPDLGAIIRDAHLGERVRISVRFHNTTGKRRTFHLAMTGPLKDNLGQVATAAIFKPETLDLDDGEIGQVVIDTEVAKGFDAGKTYSSRLVIRAEDCEPQHLTVSIRVSCDEGPVIRLCCPCDPKLRPLRWYHHYYCDPPAVHEHMPGAVIKPAG